MKTLYSVSESASAKSPSSQTPALNLWDQNSPLLARVCCIHGLYLEAYVPKEAIALSAAGELRERSLEFLPGVMRPRDASVRTGHGLLPRINGWPQAWSSKQVTNSFSGKSNP
jgi:hypothetical protein